MANLNRVMLMGNLTRDPEMRYLPNNMPVAAFGLAINRKWKNKDGQQQEETTFVDCEAFGRVAEIVNEYVRKGSPLYVEGRLKLDQWQDKEGQNRSKLKVVVENIQLLGGKPATGQMQSQHESQQKFQQKFQQQPQEQGGQYDDVPF